jgi:hypothetical protein
VNKPRGPHLKADMNVHRANPATGHCVNSLEDRSYIKDQSALLNLLATIAKRIPPAFRSLRTS